MPEVDFLPIAIAEDANVDSQADYAGSNYQEEGFQTGIAQSKQVNKGLRQGTVMAAALANFIANVLNQNVLDDGDMDTLVTQVTNAIALGAQARIVAQAGTGSIALYCSGSDSTCNPLLPSFEITMTGNVSPEFENVVPGQLIALALIQDGTGGREVTWLGNVINAGDVAPGAGQVTNFLFRVGSDNNLHAIAAPSIG